MKTTENKTEEVKVSVKPKNKYTIFPITVTEWENKGISSFTIQKAYKDSNDEWTNTASFSEADLAIIYKILSKI